MKEQIKGFQILRGLLICCVVLFHSMTLFITDYAGHIKYNSTIGQVVRTFIGTFQMPLFMSLSGFFFYNQIKAWIEGGQYNLARFVKKKFQRLMIPFIVIMFLWRKPLLMIANRKVSDIKGLTDFFMRYFLTTTTGGLWFLYVLFILFVLHYIALKFLWKSRYRLIIFLIMSLLGSITSYRFHGPVHHILLYNLYFYLGALIHQFREVRPKLWRIGNRCGRSAIIYLNIAVSFIYAFNIINNPLINQVLFTFVASIYVGTILPIFELLNFENKPIEMLGADSMGIYLLHEPMMICIGSFIPAIGWRLVMCLFLVGIFGSIGIVHLLRKLELNYLIGE